MESYRDPGNIAYRALDGCWYRITQVESAKALHDFLGSEIYSNLSEEKKIVEFKPCSLDKSREIIKEAEHSLGRELIGFTSAFQVEEIQVIAHPHEWPSEMLRSAAKLTLKTRLELLKVGLDLKDSSAYNIHFQGVMPTLVDVGSIQRWIPNPSWNAYRQFLHHFYNPMLLASTTSIPTSSFWAIEKFDGVSTSTTRRILGQRGFRFRTLIRHAQYLTSKKPGNLQASFQEISNKNRNLALKANVRLTETLLRDIDSFDFSLRDSTWSNYHLRNHYKPSEILTKESLVRNFVLNQGKDVSLLDIGANDGFFIKSISEMPEVTHVRVIDLDDQSLNSLFKYAEKSSGLSRKLSVFLADIAKPSIQSGLLGHQLAPLNARLKSDLILCHAVMHHLVISSGIPFAYAVELVKSFGDAVQFEFVDEHDDKVKLLKSFIPDWNGIYSLDEFMKILKTKFNKVNYLGQTSPTRHIIECYAR